MCVVGGLEDLGALTWSFSVVFFQDKAKVPLLAGLPCPFLSLGPFPTGHREVWSPQFPTPASLRPELGPLQKCRLSEHAFPCSKQAGGQKDWGDWVILGQRGLAGKVFSQSLVRRSSAPAEMFPPTDSPLLKDYNHTWQVLETQGGELLSRPACVSTPCPALSACVHFVLLWLKSAKTNKSLTEKDKRLGTPTCVAVLQEAFARMSVVLCGLFRLPLYFALLTQS